MADTVLASGSLTQRVTLIQDALRRAGLQPVDMRRAGTLETDVQLPQLGRWNMNDVPRIERLEGEHEAEKLVVQVAKSEHLVGVGDCIA